ncbi:MAG: SLC13 family permease [Acidilobaceae archaeon]|nr:SLC13 family permease [Acidilobaceae archaeon]MCX8166059.1 SLC13 family permease [Acidilobaceae archaeon]MDW7974702.1 SLC13 family permease [Sulfolobales archaeon]
MDTPALVVFLLTILGIIFLPMERSLVAFAGLIVMILLSASYSFVDAFKAIDWNVMMILLGMWTLSGYLSKSQLPEYIVYEVSRRTHSYAAFLLSLALIASFTTLFVDNVLVILLFGGLAVKAAKTVNKDPLTASMIVGLAANYMGTGLLLGDLPPQLLHSVAGAEFLDFIWFRNTPGTLFLLTLSFLITLAIFYRPWFGGAGRQVDIDVERPKAFDKLTASLAIGGFAAFVLLASLRPLLGVELGAIAVSVGIGVAALLEVIRTYGKREVPSFEEVLRDMEWRVFIFYATLFSLVGGLKKGGVIDSFSDLIYSSLLAEPTLSFGAVYWLTAALSSFVEHDAVILVALVTVKEVAQAFSLDPWPFYWAIVWAGTLGSNATITGAPALYLSLLLAEKERGRTSWRDWMKITVPFTLVSLTVHFVISLLVMQFW